MRIVVSGYYGFGNLGDELILKALLLQLRRLQPKAHIIVLSGSPELTSRQHHVIAIQRWNLSAALWAIFHCDIFISGGGGLLQDSTSSISPLYYLGLIAWAKLLGKKVVLWGQGIGPVTKLWNPWLCGWAARHADLVMVRDRVSLRLLRKWGVPADKIAFGADLVFGFSQKPGAGRRDKLMVVLRGRPAPALIDLLSFIHRRTRLPFVFLCFQSGRELKMINKMRAQLPFPTTVQIPSPDPAALLNLFSRAQAVLSMRFHGLVLGALAGTPAWALTASPKIDTFIKEFGQVSLAGDNALQRFTEVWKGRHASQKRLQNGVEASRLRLALAEAKLQRILKDF